MPGLHLMSTPRRRRLRVAGLCGMILCGGILMTPGDADDPQENAAAGLDESQIARGEYLVHRVAMCVECHTPRDSSGQLQMGRLLEGGRVPVARPYPTMEWALRAPRLAGLTGWSSEDIVRLLTTGARAGHESPDPPMPAFRMTREDAEAVVAYLRTLR